MTQRIYIVTIGDYSDYRIKAAYTTLEEAINYIEERTKNVEQLSRYDQDYGIEIFDGDTRKWQEEAGEDYKKIQARKNTLYFMQCRDIFRPQDSCTVSQYDFYIPPQRAFVESYDRGFIVKGTDQTEVKKVFSDTLAARLHEAITESVDKL